MKSKIAVFSIVMLAATAVWQADTVFEERQSFGEQILHLVTLRDEGFISQREYKLLKRHVLNRMMH